MVSGDQGRELRLHSVFSNPESEFRAIATLSPSSSCICF